MIGTVMNRIDLKSMSADELWALHEEISAKLAEALTVEKTLLENRLQLLQRGIELQPAAHNGKSSRAKTLGSKTPGNKTLGNKTLGIKALGNKSRGSKSSAKRSTARRPYPTVFPKYRNPEQPSETWAGRGKTPRWLTAQLESGRRIDDFKIVHVA